MNVEGEDNKSFPYDFVYGVWQEDGIYGRNYSLLYVTSITKNQS